MCEIRCTDFEISAGFALGGQGGGLKQVDNRRSTEIAQDCCFFGCVDLQESPMKYRKLCDSRGPAAALDTTTRPGQRLEQDCPRHDPPASMSPPGLRGSIIPVNVPPS